MLHWTSEGQGLDQAPKQWEGDSSSRRARLALPPRARRFDAAGAIFLLTVSTPHASSEALPTSPDVARTPPGMAGPVVAWSLDDAATACKHEPRIEIIGINVL